MRGLSWHRRGAAHILVSPTGVVCALKRDLRTGAWVLTHQRAGRLVHSKLPDDLPFLEQAKTYVENRMQITRVLRPQGAMQ